MWLPMLVIAGAGRWMSAHRLSKVTGNSAASLSSGDMITPRRSKVWKSRVVARQTSGPASENPVYTIMYSSPTRVMRGSSMPQCSEKLPTSGDIPRCGSRVQFVRPSGEVATARCDRPDLISTRTSSNVWPSKVVAPGLNAALTMLGKSVAHRIGLPSYRRNSSLGSMLFAISRISFQVAPNPPMFPPADQLGGPRHDRGGNA